MFVELIAMTLASSQPAAIEQAQKSDPPAPEQPVMLDVEHRVARPDQWARTCEDWDDWDKPGPPFKVYGNTYYVGTCGIAVLLINGEHGLTMIDTGTEKGVWLAMKNVARIGHDPLRIGLLLYSHEHFDHVGGMAAAQIYTGAPLLSSAEAADVFRTGLENPVDPQAGTLGSMKPAPSVIEIATDKPITFGNVTFTPIATPGHTPGALTWQWEACEGPKEDEVCKTIVYADSLSAISSDDYHFSDAPEYVAAFREGIERLRGLKCDILLTPHPSASNMIERAATGTFEGGLTCAEYADIKSKALDDRLAKEAAGE